VASGPRVWFPFTSHIGAACAKDSPEPPGAGHHKDSPVFCCLQSPRFIMQSHVAPAGFLSGFCTPLSFLWLPGKGGFHHALPILRALPVGPSHLGKVEFSLRNPAGLRNSGVFRRCFAASTLARIHSEARGRAGPCPGVLPGLGRAPGGGCRGIAAMA